MAAVNHVKHGRGRQNAECAQIITVGVTVQLNSFLIITSS